MLRRWLRRKIYGSRDARIRFLKYQATEAERMRDKWRDEAEALRIANKLLAMEWSGDEMQVLNDKLVDENDRLRNLACELIDRIGEIT